ncbi:MAG: DUF58 domain-containing protein [Thermoflexales bacterium]
MFSEAFLRSLRGLRLDTVRRRPGTLTGERRSPRRGRSLEFADYRNYAPGDDPRRVDWNVYARLERPYIKLFEDEQDLTVYVLLDDSPSMFWQMDDTSAPAQKWRCAAQLAASLAYVALASGDQVVIETGGGQRFGPRRGLASAAGMLAFLERLPPQQRPARLALNIWLKRVAQQARSGWCAIISDCLDEAGGEEGLTALAGRGLELHLLHVLSPDELEPRFVGDLRLRDVETEAFQDLSIDAASMQAYQRQLEAWRMGLAAAVRARGGRYRLVNSAEPIEQIVLRDLRGAGWLV